MSEVLHKLMKQKKFLQAAYEGQLVTVCKYLSSPNKSFDVNTRVQYCADYGLPTSKRFSLSGVRGFFYENFYYSSFDFYHEQRLVQKRNPNHQYVDYFANKTSFDQWYRYDMTALILAAEMGHYDVVEALLKVPGIDVNASDSQGYTALIAAAEFGHARIVRLLLEMPEIDLKKQTNQTVRVTAAQTAAYHGHHELAQLIQERMVSKTAMNLAMELN